MRSVMTFTAFGTHDEREEGVTMKMTFTYESVRDAGPVTLAFPPRWIECVVDEHLPCLKAWEDSDETTETWRQMCPSDEVLDSLWSNMSAHVLEALEIETTLPDELALLHRQIIVQGPHRVTAPACMFDVLAMLLEREADDQSEHFQCYELSVFVDLLRDHVQ